MILQAIINATTVCCSEKHQTLMENVRGAVLFALVKDDTLPEERCSRAYEMTESMNNMCYSSFEDELFNREG